MNAGRLRERVRVERPQRSRDEHGGPLLAWVLVDTRWAQVLPVSTSERNDERIVDATLTHRVMMRYMAELDSADANTWRLVWSTRGDRTLNIVGVRDPDGRKEMLEVDVKEQA